MNRKLFWSVLFFASTLCPLLSAAPGARIMIGRANSDIKLAFQPEAGVKKSYATWIGANADKMVSCVFPPSDTWQTGSVTVTPLKSGKLALSFIADRATAKGVPSPEGVYFDNIRINGKPIPNGGFEDGPARFGYYVRPHFKEFPPRIVYDPMIAKSGNNCLATWHDASVSRSIEVQENVPVTITVDYKNAGLLPAIQTVNDYFPLALDKAANMGFADEIAGDKKGGWTDQGPTNDLHTFSPGVHNFLNCRFRITDPAENNGKSCVIMKSANSPWGVEKFTLDVKNKVCDRIVLLTGAAWCKGRKGEKAAFVTVTYINGTKSVFPLIVDTHIGDWWNPPKSLTKAELAWSGTAHSNIIGLYQTVLKLPGKQNQVRSVTISAAPGAKTVLAIVGITAARVRSSEDNGGGELAINLPKPAKRIAIPLDTLLLDLRKRKMSAGTFFDEKNLNRIEASDNNGKPVKLTIAKFYRKLSPILLLSSNAPVQNLKLKLGSAGSTQVCSPCEALTRLIGPQKITFDDMPWHNGLILKADQAELKNAVLTADQDSFYRQMINFEPLNSEARFEFNLDKPETLKLFAYMRHYNMESQSNRIFAYFDDKPFVIVGGNYYKSLTNFWTGSVRVKLSEGKHTLRLLIPGKNKKLRAGLQLGSFYMARGLHNPEYPGFREEISALETAGFSVFGVEKQVAVKNIPSSHPLYRIVNEKHSYPDLSALVKNRIDRQGTLKTDGSSMRFADGTELAYIWGRNIGNRELYRFLSDEHLKYPGALDEYIKRYKSMGISSFRLFFSTMPRATWTCLDNVNTYLLNGPKLEFHPEYIPLYQRFIAAAHRNDMRLKITMGAYPWSLRAITPLAQAMFYDRRLIDLQKKRMDLLLNAPNPYRNNIRPIDDPTISIVEIENECNFLGIGLGRHTSWQTISKADKAVLYPLWQGYLKKKYQTIAQLKKQWGTLPLIDGNADEKFENIDFAPVWDVASWGNDRTDFKIQMDDLRVSSATFGKEKRSNGAVSDMFEFMYNIYGDYLKEMYTHLRSRGYKGVITTCGPDTENFYIQRAAANKYVDAVSGGTGYWNRDGYAFLRSLNWMDAMVYTTTPGKPMISREYGANLKYRDCWWGNLITATVQKSMGKGYFYNFAGGLPFSILNPDYLYPEDAGEETTVQLQQDAHFYSYFSNLAAAIAVQSNELKKSPFKIEIGVPLDNVCYSAPMRGYNKLTIKDYAPFLYLDTTVRTFDRKYDGNADLVVNEPSLPAGDYSGAKNFFAIRPHSAFDRYGKPETEWFKGKTFHADGFIDTKAERDAFYDAIVKAGGKMPVSKLEFCKVWRDAGRKLEIDTGNATFTGDTSTWCAFIGELKAAPAKPLRSFAVSGQGDAWSFFGKTPAGDLFFGILNGRAILKDTSKLNYVMAGSSDLQIFDGKKLLFSVLSGKPVNVAFKTDETNLTNARKIYVTFFRTKSCQMPAEITFGRQIRSVKACNRDGKVIANIPFAGKTFSNQWRQSHFISYFEVEF